MDDVALCVCGSGMDPDTWQRMQRLFAELLEMSKPSGNGGYWADFGPVTYARIAEFSGPHNAAIWAAECAEFGCDEQELDT